VRAVAPRYSLWALTQQHSPAHACALALLSGMPGIKEGMRKAWSRDGPALVHAHLGAEGDR